MMHTEYWCITNIYKNIRVARNPQGQRLKYRISPWTPSPSVFDWSPTLVSGRKWSAITFYHCLVLRKSTTHLISGTFQIHVWSAAFSTVPTVCHCQDSWIAPADAAIGRKTNISSLCVCFCENVGTTPLSAHHTKGSPTTDFGLFSCWCLIFSTVVNHHAGNMFFLTVWSKSKVRSGGGKCLWFHSYSTGAHGTPPWKTTNALPRK